MANLECPSVDINPLNPNGFILVFTKLEGVAYFAQEINIPGIMLGDPLLTNPFTKQPLPGDDITWEPLEITFQIDEKMSNYLAIHDWMIALGFPNNYEQYKELVGSRQKGMSELAANYSDATLFILDSNNKPIREIQFKDCFPAELSSIRFSTQNTEVRYVTCTATIRFGYYIIV